MRIAHVYATSDGESHLGDEDLFLEQEKDRRLFFNSKPFPASAIVFQHVRAGGESAWHPAPQRWVAFVLVGTWEVETSDGATRQFGQGTIALVEDTTGKGHRGRAVGEMDVLLAGVTLAGETQIASIFDLGRAG